VSVGTCRKIIHTIDEMHSDAFNSLARRLALPQYFLLRLAARRKGSESHDNAERGMILASKSAAFYITNKLMIGSR
jgi:hypothetical protein